MSYGFVYCARNITNGKVYIGQTIKTLTELLRRYRHHGSNPHWDNALKKYSIEGFEWSVLCRCVDKQELDDCEFVFVNVFKASETEFGYNKKEGGGARGKPTLETKEKMRSKALGRRHSEKTKAKMSLSFSGEGNPNFGLTRSDETKAKMSLGQHKAIDEGRRLLSVEGRDAISKANKGRIPHNKGKKMSDEQKQKLSLANLGKKLGPRTSDVKEKISKKLKGHPVSAETRQKISSKLMCNSEKTNEDEV